MSGQLRSFPTPPLAKETCFQFKRRLVGPQSRYGHFGKEGIVHWISKYMLTELSICNLQVRHPSCVYRITSIGKMQSNTTFNICIAKRFFYVGCFNDMFWPPYRPSSACTLSYHKANNTVYNVSVFVNNILFTSLKFAFKLITVAVEWKSYSDMKDIKSIRICMLWSWEKGVWFQTGDIPVWQCWFFVWFAMVAQWIGCQVVL